MSGYRAFADEEGLRAAGVCVFLTLLPSHRNDQPMKQSAMVAGCEWRWTTAGTFGRRETIFEMLPVGGDSLFPSTARHGTAILHDCGGRHPGSEALAGFPVRTGTSATGQTPLQLQADRLAPSLRNPGPAATFPFWQHALDIGGFPWGSLVV